MKLGEARARTNFPPIIPYSVLSYFLELIRYYRDKQTTQPPPQARLVLPSLKGGYTKTSREYEIFKVASHSSQCLKSYSALSTVHVLSAA